MTKERITSMRLILDTDIGTDIDDCLALALILASAEIDLIGITCVYGDVLLRSRIAMKLLQLRGRAEIPVYAGAAKPLLDIDSVYWEGHEGKLLLSPEDEALKPEPQFAADYIIETVLNNPDEIHLIAIGPLTNVAMALQKAPEVAHKLASLTIMGSVLRGYSQLDLPIAEHNIKCDPEAAQIVFSSPARICLTPLNITVQTQIDRETLQAIRGGGSAFHQAVANELEHYPRFAKQGWTSPHDPLAVAVLVQAQLITTRQVSAQVELNSRIARGAMHFTDNPEGNIAIVETVNSPAFKEFLTSRLGQAL